MTDKELNLIVDTKPLREYLLAPEHHERPDLLNIDGKRFFSWAKANGIIPRDKEIPSLAIKVSPLIGVLERKKSNSTKTDKARALSAEAEKCIKQLNDSIKRYIDASIDKRLAVSTSAETPKRKSQSPIKKVDDGGVVSVRA